MAAALPMVLLAREPEDAYAGHAPPEVALEPYTLGEIYERIRGGELDADLCEELLTRAARGRTAIDVTIAQGLAALRRGDRLAELCFHLGDYAREVLGMKPRTAQLYARLGDGLRTRPLLREAVLAGKVTFRAACEVLPVAEGEAEAAWVERASGETVRALKAAREARTVEAQDDDADWPRFRAAMTDDEREVVDEALEDDGARKAALELETKRWAHLPPVPGKAAPIVDFEALGTADRIDRDSAEDPVAEGPQARPPLPGARLQPPRGRGAPQDVPLPGRERRLLNLLGICPFHHHRCVHEGYLALDERDGVRTWLRRGEPFTGGAGGR